MTHSMDADPSFRLVAGSRKFPGAFPELQT